MRFKRTAIFCLGFGLVMPAAPIARAAGASSGMGVGVAPAEGAGEKPKDAKDEGKKGSQEVETEEMKKAMARKVSFEFIDTPVSEGVNFIDSLVSITFVIDPKVKQEDKWVTLRVTDMPASEALGKIAAAVGAKVFVKDGAYYIGKEAPGDAKKAPQAPAKLTAEQAKAVEAAIKDLASDEFATREAASKAIADAGIGALPLLQAAMKKTDDVEAQSRMKALAQAFLEELGGDEGSEALNNALERKVSFEFIDTPLSETITFLNSLVRNSGAKIEVSDTAPRDAAINLRVTEMKLGMALEWIAKLSDCQLVKSGGTVTVKRKSELDP